MKTSISKTRRKEIKAAVIKVLSNCNILTLPVDIEQIVKNVNGVRLVSYSQHMEKMSLTYKEMLAFAGSNDGCTDFFKRRNRYIVFYNDKDPLLNKTKRYRFTIAHELGHILLKHHLMTEKTRIFRASLTQEEYDILESEADYFAALILVPHIVLSHRKKPIDNGLKLARACNISRNAGDIRFSEYRRWLRNRNPNSGYDQKILDLFCKYMYKVECPNCLNQMYYYKISHCIYCGETNLKWIGDGKMIYDKFEFSKCPQCENEQINDSDNFCMICSENLQNRCTNNDCENHSQSNPLPKNARYCPHCGAETTFFQKNFLQEWDYLPEDPELEASPASFFPIDYSTVPMDTDDDDLPF